MHEVLFLGSKEAKFTCWLNVQCVSDLIMYLSRPQWYYKKLCTNIYSPFADSYLPITYFQNQLSKKLPIALPISYYFELIKVAVLMGPSVSFPLPPRVSLHACHSVYVCVCVRGLYPGRNTPRLFLLGGVFWGTFFGFKNVGIWLRFLSTACVSGPLFLGNLH